MKREFDNKRAEILYQEKTLNEPKTPSNDRIEKNWEENVKSGEKKTGEKKLESAHLTFGKSP